MSVSVSHATRFSGPIFEAGAPGYDAELAGYNLALRHTPQIVIGAESSADVSAAIHHARERNLKVSVIGGGHGVGEISDGLTITTRRMNNLSIDPERRTATFGAGVIWRDVVEAASPYGLLPVIGSTPLVGAIGYLLGGGISPIGRSHGFSSDYVERFTVVIGSGDIVEASSEENPDLFWALQGGKSGLGIVTEATIRLVEQPMLYAGMLVFEEAHIAPVVRGWIDWTATADPQVTTSVVTIDFPDMDMSPPPFRGKRVLMLRFAYPGDEARGTELAAPLRALAPAFMDMIGLMPSSEIGRIHSDPEDPLPVWEAGAQLRTIDEAFADRWLGHFGPGARSPLGMIEIRHGGNRQKADVPGGSAVTGRDAEFTLLTLSFYPPSFAEAAPAAAPAALADFEPWTLPECNVHFIGHSTTSSPWSPKVQMRLDQIRGTIDPDGIFARRW